MASITNAPKKTVPAKSAPAPKAKTEDVEEVAETTPTATKPAKTPKVAEVDPVLGLNRNQPASFRWIAVDALRATWPKSGNKADFDENACAATCAELYKERGGQKEISHEVWLHQIKTIRKWLLSKAINKPMPGDSADRAALSPEAREKLRERLAKGRATKASKAKAKSADADEGEAEEA